MGIRGNSHPQCFVERIEIMEEQISLPCNGEPYVFFEDLTSNHNKATLTLFNSSLENSCLFSVIIVTDQGEINRPITNFSKRFELENVRAVIIECTGTDPEGMCSGQVTYTHDFCICCP